MQRTKNTISGKHALGILLYILEHSQLNVDKKIQTEMIRYGQSN